MKRTVFTLAASALLATSAIAATPAFEVDPQDVARGELGNVTTGETATVIREALIDPQGAEFTEGDNTVTSFDANSTYVTDPSTIR